MFSLKYLRSVLLAGGLVLGTANAQTATDTASTASGTNTSSTRPDDRRGFDYGWLGLIGLAGLLGLRKRERMSRA
ncbi:MAG: WGxxGxxG family protein [Bryobacteraceae bacterium]